MGVYLYFCTLIFLIQVETCKNMLLSVIFSVKVNFVFMYDLHDSMWEEECAKGAILTDSS